MHNISFADVAFALQFHPFLLFFMLSSFINLALCIFTVLINHILLGKQMGMNNFVLHE